MMMYSPSVSNKKISSSLKSSNMAATREVEGNDDMLTVILVRLPARLVFRFRCVSKRWNNIISKPFFLQAYCRNLRKTHTPKVVMYIQETYSDADSENFYHRDSESTRTLQLPHGSEIIEFKSTTRNLYIANSSNGLILFQRGGPISNNYLILNPITNRTVYLTRPLYPTFLGSAALALVCEENTNELVPKYKVVIAGMRKDQSHVTTTTFCSKTGKWTTSTPTTTGSLKNDILERYSSSPFVVDGIIHWFTRDRVHLIVYYVESNTIQLVELPPRLPKKHCLKVARSSCNDDLWLFMNFELRFCIEIWMLPCKEYDSYRSRSMTIPSDAWIYTQRFCTSLVVFPTDGSTIQRDVYPSWSREGVEHKLPHVAFFMVRYEFVRVWNLAEMSYEIVTHCPGSDLHGSNRSDPHNSNRSDPHGYNRSDQHSYIPFRYDIFPCMEALALSSYAL